MTGTPTRRRRTIRKSLKQSLKELLHRCQRQRDFQPGRVGSGILRRAANSIYLSEPSFVSLFPDFESSTRFDIDSYSVHILNHFAEEPEATSKASSLSSTSRASLLPARSLSHFDLNQVYVQHNRSYHPTQLSIVPELLAAGASREASLVSVRTVLPSKSTLKIRGSTQTLRRDRVSQSDVFHYLRTSQVRSWESLDDLRSLASFRTDVDDISSLVSSATAADAQSGTGRPSSSNPSISSIKHFRSFCVLDTCAPGCPVTATSEDLRYVFDVGEQFFLNNQKCEDASMDIVTGFDADGSEVTHLVLFSPLISPSSGQSRFLLAALIDVTFFIEDAATVPELDTISEESVKDESVTTPGGCKEVSKNQGGICQQLSSTSRVGDPRRNVRYELSCEDLLGGCYIAEDLPKSYLSTNDHGIVPGMSIYADMKRGPTMDDVWTDLAREEMIRKRKSPLPSAARFASGHSTQQTSPQLSTPSSNTSQVDDVLDNFMLELQQLYSNFFLLAKSPLDAEFYEICNVSTSIYVSKEYVHGHLSRSSHDTITRLSESLGGDIAFDMNIRWGVMGDVQQLYCIPLFGQRDLTWICMLVDVKLGLLS